jgi:hypothetical protein
MSYFHAGFRRKEPPPIRVNVRRIFLTKSSDKEHQVSELIPIANAKAATQADGRTMLVDATNCLGSGAYPCPGCSNCDRFVPWVDESGA